MKLYPKIIVFFVFILFISCKKSESDEFIENPDWLVDFISSIENDKSYEYDKIYRHNWKKQHYYHFFKYYSSCIYCKVYDYEGRLVDWSNEDIDDYQENRRNEVLIWEYK